MKTVHSFPSIETYIHFNPGIDVHDAARLRQHDCDEYNRKLLAGAKVAGARWREEVKDDWAHNHSRLIVISSMIGLIGLSQLMGVIKGISDSRYDNRAVPVQVRSY